MMCVYLITFYRFTSLFLRISPIRRFFIAFKQLWLTREHRINHNHCQSNFHHKKRAKARNKLLNLTAYRGPNTYFILSRSSGAIKKLTCPVSKSTCAFTSTPLGKIQPFPVSNFNGISPYVLVRYVFSIRKPLRSLPITINWANYII